MPVIRLILYGGKKLEVFDVQAARNRAQLYIVRGDDDGEDAGLCGAADRHRGGRRGGRHGEGMGGYLPVAGSG